MSRFKFKKTAIAVAVLGALASGAAQAAAPVLATAPNALASGTSYNAFVKNGTSASANVRFNTTEDISVLATDGPNLVDGVFDPTLAGASIDGALDLDNIVNVGNITSVNDGSASIQLTLNQGNITTVGVAAFKWDGTQLTIVDTGDETFTPLVVTLALGAGALSDGQDTTPNDGIPDNPSLIITLGTYNLANIPSLPGDANTLDNDADGDLDGVTIDFEEDVTVSAGVGGVVLTSTDGGNALTPGSVTASGSTVTALASMATPINTGDVTTYAVDYTNGGEFLTFVNIYNNAVPALGAAFAKEDVATAGLLGNVDNAKPVLLSVEKIQDKLTEGTVNLTFSEAMNNSGELADVDVDGNTLELAVLNAEDQGDPAGKQLGLAEKNIPNDTVIFENIDNDVLEAIGDAGVFAGNDTLVDPQGLEADA